MAAENRSAARLAACQALYQMEVAGKGLKEILAEFETCWIGAARSRASSTSRRKSPFSAPSSPAWWKTRSTIDRAVDKTLSDGWPLRRIEALMRAILRAGAFELLHRGDIPARVAIKEYVDVAGAFFDREEAGMINAVLDALARKRAADEFRPDAHFPLITERGRASDCDADARRRSAAGQALMDEAELIARYFAPLAGPGGLGLRDDAALLAPPPGCELVAHCRRPGRGRRIFSPPTRPTASPPRRSASICPISPPRPPTPLGFLLTLALPPGWTPHWLDDVFARARRSRARDGNVPLLGGDTVATAGR